MKIILEGCDGTGKSTVAKMLRLKYPDLNFIKLSGSDVCTKEFFSQTLELSNFIMDRNFISEEVYPDIMGRYSRLCGYDASNLHMKLLEKKVHVFIFTAPTHILQKRLDKRGDETEELVSKIPQIKKAYEDIADYHDYTLIDTHENNVVEILDIIERKVRHGKHKSNYVKC